MLMALVVAGCAIPLPTERPFTPGAAPATYRVTQVRRSPIGPVKVSIVETLRIVPAEGGFRAVIESGAPTIDAPAALVPQLKVAMGAFTRIPTTFLLDRAGHPLAALDVDRTWAAIVTAIDEQVAIVRKRSPAAAASIEAFRTAFAGKPQVEREAALLDIATTLLGFVPDALAPGQTLSYATDAAGPGTIRRLPDEDGAARFHVEATGGNEAAHEVIDVAVDPDGLLRWLRRAVTPLSATAPETAVLIERQSLTVP